MFHSCVKHMCLKIRQIWFHTTSQDRPPPAHHHISLNHKFVAYTHCTIDGASHGCCSRCYGPTSAVWPPKRYASRMQHEARKESCPDKQMHQFMETSSFDKRPIWTFQHIRTTQKTRRSVEVLRSRPVNTIKHILQIKIIFSTFLNLPASTP